jgi:hypothetical protein
VVGGVKRAKGAVTKIDGAIGRSGEAMPEEPPSANWIRKRCIVRVLAKKMTVIMTMSGTIEGSRVKRALSKIDLLDKVPTRAKSAGRAVGYKEETVW